MKIKIFKNSEILGNEAAKFSADILNRAITKKGKARLVLATGDSQWDTLKALVKKNVDWRKVELFHLDEFINLPIRHPASLRKHLKERFINLVNLKNFYLINGEGDVSKNIQDLTNEIRKESIDLALVGIGENAHIAFNDPPADFDTKEAYIVVDLNEDYKKQKVRGGWFSSVIEMPKRVISMTVYEIMQSEVIVSCVPYKIKANAIKLTLENDITNTIPATKLKEHSNVILFLDEDSASLVDKDVLNKYR